MEMRLHDSVREQRWEDLERRRQMPPPRQAPMRGLQAEQEEGSRDTNSEGASEGGTEEASTEEEAEGPHHAIPLDAEGSVGWWWLSRIPVASRAPCPVRPEGPGVSMRPPCAPATTRADLRVGSGASEAMGAVPGCLCSGPATPLAAGVALCSPGPPVGALTAMPPWGPAAATGAPTARRPCPVFPARPLLLLGMALVWLASAVDTVGTAGGGWCAWSQIVSTSMVTAWVRSTTALLDASITRRIAQRSSRSSPSPAHPALISARTSSCRLCSALSAALVSELVHKALKGSDAPPPNGDECSQR
ncbi:UNVERIFIED_CONTAM: hypothetical protein K2H54_017485 [Gekko kuhli]